MNPMHSEKFKKERKITMSKKKILVAALALIVVATLSFGTLAWFTDSDEITNDFMIAGSENNDPDDIFSVDVWEDLTDDDVVDKNQDDGEFKDVLPGDDWYKDVNVENTGAYPQYARVLVTVTEAHIWQEIFGEIYVPLEKIATDLSADFMPWSIEFNADEDTLTYVLYYNADDGILEPDEYANLFTNVHIPEALDRDQAAEMDGGFKITVVAEAVQTENVGINAVEAFATVGMAIEAGNSLIAETPVGVMTALTLDMDVVLENDVDMTDVAWAPVGTEDEPYTGTFDGNGYTIYNLAVTADDAAMFGYVGNGATIKNLKFENVNINGTDAATVAICAEGATIEDITVLSGTVTAKNSEDAGAYGAGIVVETDGATIKNCINNADVDSEYSASGISGWCLNTTVDGCENNGDITGANRAGGICGNFSGTMTNCTNNGDVTGNGKMPAGGIVGVLSGAATIENCTNHGDVTTTVKNDNASAAGILGHTPSAKVTIKSCSNTGAITAESHAAGIAVSLYGGVTADGCTNTGVITGTGKGTADIVAAKGVFSGSNTIQ